jgi:hypothetical protein
MASKKCNHMSDHSPHFGSFPSNIAGGFAPPRANIPARAQPHFRPTTPTAPATRLTAANDRRTLKEWNLK